MTKEIEKKYLLYEEGLWFGAEIGMIRDDNVIRKAMMLEYARPSRENIIRQGYLTLDQGLWVARDMGIALDFTPDEARIRDHGGRYFLTLKSDGTVSRDEKETEIPQEVFDFCWPYTYGKRVRKTRIKMPWQGLTAEIDLYLDRELMIAEVECPDLETAQRLTPLGKDVTEDPRYKNRNLGR
jgi:CYTH domain-containing protein